MACRPHGVSGDCGTCALEHSIKEARVALGFSDRRPAPPVPKGQLRSHEALAAHLAEHHVPRADFSDRSHSELREYHADHHNDQFAVIVNPHVH